MNLHAVLLYGLVGMAVATVALILDQVWLRLVPWDIFVRLGVTFVILSALDLFLILVRADLTQNKKLKDENYLD